jgi:NADH-quinone oxidoreductase subunit K
MTFFIGLLGIVFNRKNILLMLISIELCLLSINFSLLCFSVVLDDILGQVFAIFILTVAAAETSIGLAILVLYFRFMGTLSVELIKNLKG